TDASTEASDLIKKCEMAESMHSKYRPITWCSHKTIPPIKGPYENAIRPRHIKSPLNSRDRRQAIRNTRRHLHPLRSQREHSGDRKDQRKNVSAHKAKVQQFAI